VVITYSFEKGWFLELKKVSVNWPKSIADKWMGCAKTQRECKGFKDFRNSIMKGHEMIEENVLTMPANRRQLKQHFDDAPEQVREHFSDLPGLLENFSLDVALAYVFSRVELAHNMALYCGVVKIHNASREVAGAAIDANHMTRESLLEMFKTVFNRDLPTATLNLLENAEGVRDRVMHGKKTPEHKKREAIVEVIQYAEKFNETVYAAARFRPFGNLQGFHGRGQSLSKATTRWVLKGMDFSLS